MSETDSFIEEVSEEVRRDQLFKLFRKWGWLPALIIILVVGGAAFNEYRKATQQAEAERIGDALLTALALPSEARLAAVEGVTSDDAGTRAVIGLVTAAAAADGEDVAAADAALAAMAADPSTPELYRDLASFKRLTLNDSPMTRNDRIATIDALSRPGGPFRALATEQRGILLIEDGDVDGAMAIFRDLAQDAEATPSQIQRIRQLMIVLGGDPNDG